MQGLELLKKYAKLSFGEAAVESITPMDSAAVQFQSIQRFSSTDSCSFLFIMTPDLCGLGTHLPDVSLVIIFDSPPDPLQDIVALARGHKIGTQDVLPVIRLFMAASAEEKMLHIADNSKKCLASVLGLNHSRGTAGGCVCQSAFDATFLLFRMCNLATVLLSSIVTQLHFS